MKRLTIREIELQDTQDVLGSAIETSAALMEAMSELLMKGLTGDCLSLSSDTVRGLHLLAEEQGSNLRERFHVFVEMRNKA